MLEVVMVAELCRNGTLRDHIDVQASLKAAAAAPACDAGSGSSPSSSSSSSGSDSEDSPLLKPEALQPVAGTGNAACRCAECQERAPPPTPPMRWGRALPKLTFASAHSGRRGPS